MGLSFRNTFTVPENGQYRPRHARPPSLRHALHRMAQVTILPPRRRDPARDTDPPPQSTTAV